MTSVDKEKMDQDHQIITAAGWNENGDSSYKAFQDLMRKRKELANAFLCEGDFEKQQQLKEMILYLNRQIRLVLGI